MSKMGVLGLMLSVSIALSCGGSGGGGGIVSPPPPPPPPPPGGTQCAAGTVCMRGATFDPAELSVARGAVVTFENNSGVIHTVVFDAPVSPGVTDIGQVNNGQSAARTFTTAGSWNYHCTIHAGMTGKINVT